MRLRPSLALLVVFALAPPAFAEVPLDAGLRLMLKMLTYDSSFKARGSGEFLVLVPFDEATKISSREVVGAASRMSTTNLRDRTLLYLAVPVEELDDSILRRKAAAVLLPPGLGVDAARRALAVAQARAVYTLAYDEALVRSGAVLGVAEESSRLRVLINAEAAKKIGADFAPVVMRVARSVR